MKYCRYGVKHYPINQSVYIKLIGCFTDLAFQEGMQNYITTQVILGKGVYISKRKHLLVYYSCS